MDNISFEQFITTFRFNRYAGYNKEIREEIEDTYTVRIYLPDDLHKWFEFGIYDLSNKEYTWEMCKEIFSEEILKSYVGGISYNVYDENLSLVVYLTKERCDSEKN